MTAAAIGIDWSPRGWVAVGLRTAGPPAVACQRSLADLIGRFAEAECIAIDMPIGFPTSRRAADLLARVFVGPRRSSVFMTPPREVLEAQNYEDANVIAAEMLDGKKISKQAWALRENIFVVAAEAGTDARILEVHPEVSFRAMTGQALDYSKNSWNGQAIRRDALTAQGITLPATLDEGGDVPPADLLDAAAAAWSARRVTLGLARSLPPQAAHGARGVIWY
jgi:predicted RNase H-like nuclease